MKGRGFILQDRGGLFVLDPSHPNALAPRKRPFHTIIPAFMEQGDIHIGFGIMGGANQPAGARAICFECCGLRNEYSGCALRAALHRASHG